ADEQEPPAPCARGWRRRTAPPAPRQPETGARKVVSSVSPSMEWSGGAAGRSRSLPLSPQAYRPIPNKLLTIARRRNQSGGWIPGERLSWDPGGEAYGDDF